MWSNLRRLADRSGCRRSQEAAALGSDMRVCDLDEESVPFGLEEIISR